MRLKFLIVVFVLSFDIAFSQTGKTDSVRLDYRQIYSSCLDGNVKPIVEYISGIDSNRLSAKDQTFKRSFESRFRYATDRDHYVQDNNVLVAEILKIYRDYWRVSLLDSSVHRDNQPTTALGALLQKQYPAAKEIMTNNDSLDSYLKKYIFSSGYFTTGFSKTGKFYDLLVWKNQQDTTYLFTGESGTIPARVFFMENFVTLGWEEYATMNTFYPGGWANDTALYCVKKAYDLHSELFLISYLAHEGRHMADYKQFPKLTSADLEYRGKLTELSLADSTLYALINFFIANANYNSGNGHSIANYCAIRDLSLAIFHRKFEKDLNAWKKIPKPAIHEAAKEILRSNTRALLALGPDTGARIYIKQAGE